MEIVKAIHDAALREGKRFLLIGGHALNVHGISRTTGDIDLMVESLDVQFWRDLLSRLGYTIFHETSGFLQSKPPSIAAWPIDLMLVGAETMTKALQDASTTDALGTALHVASVESLIEMKLHALRYVDEVRALKDQSDLLALLEVTRIAMDPECFPQLCDPYGHLTGMTESHDSKNKGAMSAVSLAPMEFPSGVSVVSTPPKIDLKEMIALSERYLPILNAHPDFVEKKKRSVINVPFVL